MELSYLNLYTTDPAFNLAAEQYVFDNLPRDHTYFMLWQNDNAIIVGKYQNTIAEVNETYVREHNIRVVRRLSGGGAVYHDLGNLNFTFIADAGDLYTLDFKLFCEPIVRTLAKFGVKAEISGRNDMTIAGKKFSGNSQYLRQGRVMHHGTILFDSDLSAVSQALQVDESKFESKASKSVRSHVTNVAEHLPRPISMEEFRRTLLSDIVQSANSQAYLLTGADHRAIQKLCDERYDTWEWNYGFSPTCTIHRRARMEGCGLLDIYISVEHGVISALRFHGDFFSILEPDELASRFVGHRPEAVEYETVLADVDVSQYFVGLQNAALLHILCNG